MKKHLNMLENPMYPTIRRALPRFQTAGKHWTVDVGRTIMEQEHHPQLIEHAVLAQSRDHQREMYGLSSHREVVNKNFRPPLKTFEDDIAVHKIPRRPTVPRMNQGTDTQPIPNSELNNTDKLLTRRKRPTHVLSSRVYPHDFSENRRVIPDLETKFPRAGMVITKNIPYRARNEYYINRSIKMREPLGIQRTSEGYQQRLHDGSLEAVQNSKLQERKAFRS